MPQKRLRRRQIVVVAVSLLDDLIVLIIILVLSRFIRLPVWLVIAVASPLLASSVVSYIAVTRNPQMGFENMIGATGVVVDPLSPSGTIRIGHERWAARSSQGHLGAGVEVVVVGQSGLLLAVVGKEGGRTPAGA